MESSLIGPSLRQKDEIITFIDNESFRSNCPVPRHFDISWFHCKDLLVDFQKIYGS